MDVSSAPFEISNVDTTIELNQLEIKYSNLMEEARSINKNIQSEHTIILRK